MRLRRIENLSSMLVDDVQGNHHFYREADEVSGFTTRNMICVPVRAKGRILGVLQAINKRERAFESDDVVVLHALANQVAVAIENAQLYHESINDALMGLYHRRFLDLRLNEELDRSTRYRHPLSLVMIDIDFFKQVNDTHGHPAGDAVLKGVAAILKKGTRVGDIVARYGGEEFLVIVPYIAPVQVQTLAERLRRAVEAAEFDGVTVTISAGVAYFDGLTAMMPGELVARADKALYAAKNAGRNRVVVCDSAAATA